MANKVVVASNSDFGVNPKEVRGLVDGLADMPSSLRPMKNMLDRVANKLGLALDGKTSVQDIAAKAELAMRARLAVAAAPAAPSVAPGAPGFAP